MPFIKWNPTRRPGEGARDQAIRNQATPQPEQVIRPATPPERAMRNS